MRVFPTEGQHKRFQVRQHSPTSRSRLGPCYPNVPYPQPLGATISSGRQSATSPCSERIAGSATSASLSPLLAADPRLGQMAPPPGRRPAPLMLCPVSRPGTLPMPLASHPGLGHRPEAHNRCLAGCQASRWKMQVESPYPISLLLSHNKKAPVTQRPSPCLLLSVSSPPSLLTGPRATFRLRAADICSYRIHTFW
jgi:hypothetical protein